MEGQEFALPGLHAFLASELKARIPGLDCATPILDLGCGSGAWISRLALAGFTNLTGVDNASFAELPPSSDRMKFAHGDLDAYAGFPLGNYGLITAIEVFEHSSNAGNFLAHIRRHLLPHGYFLMTTPNVHSLRTRIRFALTGKLAQFDPTGVPVEETHIYPIFLTCLERLLPRYGLEISQRWTYTASGSRVLARFIAATLRSFLPDEYPGDSLCLLIRRTH